MSSGFFCPAQGCPLRDGVPHQEPEASAHDRRREAGEQLGWWIYLRRGEGRDRYRGKHHSFVPSSSGAQRSSSVQSVFVPASEVTHTCAWFCLAVCTKCCAMRCGSCCFRRYLPSGLGGGNGRAIVLRTSCSTAALNEFPGMYSRKSLQNDRTIALILVLSTCSVSYTHRSAVYVPFVVARKFKYVFSS